MEIERLAVDEKLMARDPDCADSYRHSVIVLILRAATFSCHMHLKNKAKTNPVL